mmetsp:Transcript_30445/g.81899  ORF Transcript_30445/g.81899 Transcript_30445/m.81899 type:complete len:267 (-) Transcript_30445:2-802(-)
MEGAENAPRLACALLTVQRVPRTLPRPTASGVPGSWCPVVEISMTNWLLWVQRPVRMCTGALIKLVASRKSSYTGGPATWGRSCTLHCTVPASRARGRVTKLRRSKPGPTSYRTQLTVSSARQRGHELFCAAHARMQPWCTDARLSMWPSWHAQGMRCAGRRRLNSSKQMMHVAGSSLSATMRLGAAAAFASAPPSEDLRRVLIVGAPSSWSTSETRLLARRMHGVVAPWSGVKGSFAPWWSRDGWRCWACMASGRTLKDWMLRGS